MSTEVDDATTFCVETLSFFFVWLFETTYTLSSAELETERGDITDDSSIDENVCGHLEILSSPNFPGRFKQARLDVRSFGELVLDHCIVVVVTVFLFSERHLPHLKARLWLLAKAKQVLT